MMNFSWEFREHLCGGMDVILFKFNKYTKMLYHLLTEVNS